MKSTLALIFFLASILHSTVAVTTVKPTTQKPTTQKPATTTAPSLSGEAKHRKDDCGDLVKDNRKPKSNQVDSGEYQAPPGQYCLCYDFNGTLVTSGTEAPEVFNCELLDALYNMSVAINDKGEQALFIQLIEELRVTILIDVTLTDVEKVVECSYALKNFLSIHEDVDSEISFEMIGSWGYLIDFLYVAVDLQADIVESVVQLDSNGNCNLFEALLNATQPGAPESQEKGAVEMLIEELLVTVFDNVQLTYAQKMAAIYDQLELFFNGNVTLEESFDMIIIPGFGSFESFKDVCHGYKKALTIGEIIGGDGNQTILCQALNNTIANTSYSLSVRSQLKQLLVKIETYFASQVDIQLRLTYISQQCFQLFAIEEFIVPFLDEIELDVHGKKWGKFYDVLWCSEFCKNEGNCGNLDIGEPADCDTRSNLIVISSTNTTILTTVIGQSYAVWNTSVKAGFNTCYNQIRNDIWNKVAFPTSALKIKDLVKNMKAYNGNNKQQQDVFFNVTIAQWQGTIAQFVACG